MAYFFGGYGMSSAIQEMNLGLSREISRQYAERDQAIHDAFVYQHWEKTAIAQYNAEKSMIATAIAIDTHSSVYPTRIDSVISPIREHVDIPKRLPSPRIGGITGGRKLISEPVHIERSHEVPKSPQSTVGCRRGTSFESKKCIMDLYSSPIVPSKSESERTCVRMQQSRESHPPPIPPRDHTASHGSCVYAPHQVAPTKSETSFQRLEQFCDAQCQHLKASLSHQKVEPKKHHTLLPLRDQAQIEQMKLAEQRVIDASKKIGSQKSKPHIPVFIPGTDGGLSTEVSVPDDAPVLSDWTGEVIGHGNIPYGVPIKVKKGHKMYGKTYHGVIVKIVGGLPQYRAHWCGRESRVQFKSNS